MGRRTLYVAALAIALGGAYVYVASAAPESEVVIAPPPASQNGCAQMAKGGCVLQNQPRD